MLDLVTRDEYRVIGPYLLSRHSEAQGCVLLRTIIIINLKQKFVHGGVIVKAYRKSAKRAQNDVFLRVSDKI
jgi:hypothetical protein